MIPARSTAVPGPRPEAAAEQPPQSLQSMERPMPRYAPELVASVIDDYLHTDKPVGQTAREHGINERDVTRIRHQEGIPARGARVRALPTAMAALLETRALLKAVAPPPDDVDDVGRNNRGEA